MKRLDDTVNTVISNNNLTIEEKAGLQALASIIESNIGLGGHSAIRHQWSPVFRYIKNRYDEREMLFKIAVLLTQELGWPEWMVNIFKTGRKPQIVLRELTLENLNDPTPEQRTALDVEGWEKLDVVEFSGKPMAIAFTSVIHPGLNEMTVIDLDYETSERFRPAIFHSNYYHNKHTIGHIYIYHADEGGSFIISEYIPNGTLTETKCSTVTLAFRVEPATKEDRRKIVEEFEDRLEGAMLNQQVELMLKIEAQLHTEIPDAFRRARKERGWSQKQLGEKLGVSQQMVAAIEAGSRKAQLELWQKFVELVSRPPVEAKLEDLITGGLSPQEIQASLAKMVRETTGKPARGQLWQPCLVDRCDIEPVCLNCLKCEAHCECEWN